MSDRAYLRPETPVDAEDPVEAAPPFWRDIVDNSAREKNWYINRLNLFKCKRCRLNFTDFTVKCCEWSMDDFIKSIQLPAVCPEESGRALLTDSRATLPPLLYWKTTDLWLVDFPFSFKGTVWSKVVWEWKLLNKVASAEFMLLFRQNYECRTGLMMMMMMAVFAHTPTVSLLFEASFSLTSITWHVAHFTQLFHSVSTSIYFPGMKIDRGTAEGGRRGAAQWVTGSLKSLIGLWSSNRIKHGAS